MNRRTFGLAVRLLAVVAAIYAFFSLRSQVANQQPSRGPIPVKVVSQGVCGWVTVQKAPSTAVQPAATDKNITLQTAIGKPGERVEVRSQEECDRLMKLNGSVFSTTGGTFTLEFKRN